MAKSNRISFIVARDRLVQIVYASSDLRHARDAAKKAINRAVEKGNLVRSSLGDFSRTEFDLWAAKQWPNHRNIFGVPPAEVVAATRAIKGREIGLHLLSADPSKLRKLYIRELKLRRECEQRLDVAQRELDALKNKKRALSKVAREFGQKGGRGHHAR